MHFFQRMLVENELMTRLAPGILRSNLKTANSRSIKQERKKKTSSSIAPCSVMHNLGVSALSLIVFDGEKDDHFILNLQRCF